MSVIEDLRTKCWNVSTFSKQLLTEKSWEKLMMDHWCYEPCSDNPPVEVIAKWLSTFYGKFLPRFGMIIKKKLVEQITRDTHVFDYVMNAEQVHEFMASQVDGFISSNLLKLNGIELNQAIFVKSGENFRIADKLRKYIDYFASMCDLFLSDSQKEEATKPEEPVEEKKIVPLFTPEQEEEVKTITEEINTYPEQSEGLDVDLSTGQAVTDQGEQFNILYSDSSEEDSGCDDPYCKSHTPEENTEWSKTHLL